VSNVILDLVHDDKNTLFRKLKNIYHLLQAIFANVWYRFPGNNLICIGVTGTDGKSTTANLIYHILQTAGKKTGVISTVACKINDENFNIGFHTTTPSASHMQKLLKEMVERKCKYAVIEVASHGIDQKRIWGIKFKVGVLTNITREHLDYHGNLGEYMRTKLAFMQSAKIACINVKYKNDFKSSKIIFTYGINAGDYKAENISRYMFTLTTPNNSYQIKHQLLGEFNIENIMAAYVACDVLGIEKEKIQDGIRDFKGIKGRLEEIINDSNLRVFVDFAHTPNAIEQVLKTLKEEFPAARIIHVYGATGMRDRDKRPIMGEISGTMADICVLTTEDTYGEDPLRIVLSIEKGVKKTSKILNESYFIEPDRRKAFTLAVEMARPGDVVVATGVGHQTTLNVGHEIEWSDQEELRKILASTNKIFF
jgi:UDP-N-acetylmuramoyl-L-alanyl-D-glutamate--2,6-diaminopimelate ligase